MWNRVTDWVNDRGPLVRGAVAAALGVVAATGQAPFDLWPLTVLALAALFGLLRAPTGMARGLWLGLTAGTGYFALALSWIVEPFLIDVARHAWMAPFALVLMAGGMGLFWMAAFGVARALGGGALAWAAAMTAGEAVRGVIFTGFPWAQIGHVWITTPILHWAAFGGALGLCMLAALAGAALWHVLAGARLWGGLGFVALGLAYGVGPWMAPAPEVPVDAPIIRLVQPNAPQDEKWDRDMMPVFFERQLGFTAAGAPPDLVVWPETSVPVLLERAEAELVRIASAARGASVVVGLQRADDLRYYNSLLVLDGQGRQTAVYDKHHLVPFGEYVPFGDVLGRFGITGFAARYGNGYSAGSGARLLDMGGLGRALPLICYEGVFPRNIHAAPQRPDFMLLITNDAWFGQVSGPYQHLAQARLRSVEQGLAMIRVANTGVSAMIDPAGRVTASIPMGQAGWLDVPLPPAAPPTVYARTGDWVMWGLLIVLAGLSWKGTRRRA
ncbi:apolipoprotein N-acyltransferase [Roseovarius aestuarii]|nr:apolipoprotein N-acyltransferase [Roseovarius aestuarii]